MIGTLNSLWPLTYQEYSRCGSCLTYWRWRSDVSDPMYFIFFLKISIHIFFPWWKKFSNTDLQNLECLYFDHNLSLRLPLPFRRWTYPQIRKFSWQILWNSSCTRWKTGPWLQSDQGLLCKHVRRSEYHKFCTKNNKTDLLMSKIFPLVVLKVEYKILHTLNPVWPSENGPPYCILNF